MHGSALTVQDIIKQQQEKRDSSEPVVYNIQYDIVKSPSKVVASLPKNSKNEETEEDLSDSELLEMFTEIFSILLLKKRNKYLKLKHQDKNALLPHPSLLLKNPAKQRKRELKKQLKEEQRRLVREKGNQYFGSGSAMTHRGNGYAQMNPYGQYQPDHSRADETQISIAPESNDFYQTNPYFHSLLKAKPSKQDSNQK